MDLLLQKLVYESVFYSSFVKLFKIKPFEKDALRFLSPQFKFSSLIFFIPLTRSVYVFSPII